MEKRTSKWRGVYTAMATPFLKNGEIDWATYQVLLEKQKAAKVAGVIPCGTTGESPTLSLEEKKKLILFTLKTLAGSDLKVIAGTGSNNTAETVEFSAWASDQGVHGVLVVTPYYNKPSQTGLLQHFTAVASRINCDLILYNVPGRTSVSLSAETVAKLAAHPRITAIKEATGNLAFTSEIVDALHLAGMKLGLLTGDDPTFLPFLALGGVGIISVASNIVPRELVELQSEFEKGNTARAREIHEKLFPVFKDLFIEANPVPLKFALSLLGHGTATVRAPLAELSIPNGAALKASLIRAGVLVEK